MGKTYKRLPEGVMRSPRGRKKALIEKEKHGKIRNKAIPPDAWDDIQHDQQAYVPWRAAERMLDQGLDVDTIVKRLRQKFKLTQRQAEDILLHKV